MHMDLYYQQSSFTQQVCAGRESRGQGVGGCFVGLELKDTGAHGFVLPAEFIHPTGITVYCEVRYCEVS